MITKQWNELARRILIRDEGLRLHPYKDSHNFWTIGVGRFIGANLQLLKISKATAIQMLDEDIETAWKDTCSIFGQEIVDNWPIARQLAVHSLLFNLGATKFKEFERTIQAIKSANWQTAALHLSDSLWAKQVGKRSERIISMIKSGEIHEEYAG